MRAIIFGINGQDGDYLATSCKNRQIEVIGVSRRGNVDEVGDVSDFGFVESLVRAYSPDFIFHLAANSTMKHDAVFENYATISTGALNILEAVKRHRPSCRVFIAGSGVQFLNRGVPIAETDPFDATSPYAMARIQSVYAARYYRLLGIKVYVGYLFHHESPARQAQHICKKVVDAAQMVRQGRSERLRLGDISVRKEVGFAGDIVEGILTLVMQDSVFEATIGTGLTYSIEEWLEACFTLAGKDWHDYVDVGIDGFKAEYAVLVSNPATINALGWYPKVGFSAVAKMMMD